MSFPGANHFAAGRFEKTRRQRKKDDRNETTQFCSCATALVFDISAFQIFRMVRCTVRCKGKVLLSAIRSLEALPFVNERYDSVGDMSLRIC